MQRVDQPESDAQAQWRAKRKEQDEFADAHNLNKNALYDAIGIKDDWKTNPETQREYNEYEPAMRKYADDKTPKPWVDPPQPMEAPTVRGARQCYCLVCKRKVTPVGARIVGNRCCGTCPLCQRKVCTFVAKTQAKQKPAKKRAPVKKTGKKKKKSA